MEVQGGFTFIWEGLGDFKVKEIIKIGHWIFGRVENTRNQFLNWKV